MHSLRDALRSLKSTPSISAIAVASLALGIGANTALFSILDHLVLRTLPVHDPTRLVTLGLDEVEDSWSHPVWEAIRERSAIVDGALAYSSGRFNLSQSGPTEMVDGIWVSGSYFETLGVPAIIGRTLTPEDDRRGGGTNGPVAVISYAFWQRRFGGAVEAVGQSLTVERVPFTIVGVSAPGFFGTDVGRTFDIALPIGAEPLIRGRESHLDRRSSGWLAIIFRLEQGQDLESATAAIRGIQSQVREATIPPDYGEIDKKQYLSLPFTLYPAATGLSTLRARYQRPLLTVMVVVALVLLIACANVANLLLARATARRHEMSVRVALGASRARLVRQLFSESLMLAGGGALLGLVFAHWGSHLLVRQLSTTTSHVFLDLALDWRMLGFTASLAIATAILFGTAPALGATQVTPNDALKQRSRGFSGDGRLPLRDVLVVVQVALSLVLVVAAGLFLRTFSSLSRVPLGFDRDPVLVASINAQQLQLDPVARTALFERLRRAVADVPGVHAAAVSVLTPVSNSSWQFHVGVVGEPSPPGRAAFAYINMISADFFRTYGTRMLAGRDFTGRDTKDAPPVAIVNEAFARTFAGGANPLGKQVHERGFPGRPALTREIVGYVQDAIYRSLRTPAPPTMYIPIAQYYQPPSSTSISVRAAAGSPALLAKPVAAALTAVNRDIAMTFRALDDQLGASLTQERIVAMLSGFFGALALLLASLGLYGVTSYAVNRRRGEIGIRMALGASPGSVMRHVLARVTGLMLAGVLVGGAVSLWASQHVATLLYGLTPRDPATIVMATAILAAVGVLAGWLPARRAAMLDPARVLRDA
jgi:putative ABC transport system permease protein